MQKVYLLLRNNQQTGPYSLEELLQLNLKPFDLVWEEGRSAAWRYPSEVDSLQSYVSPTPKPESPFEPVPTAVLEEVALQENYSLPARKVEPATKKVFVSMPSGKNPVPAKPSGAGKHTDNDPVSRKADDISTKVQQHSKEVKLNQPKPEPVGSFEETGAGYSNRINHYSYFTTKKTANKFRKKDIMITAAIVIVIVAGYMLLSNPSLTTPAQPDKSIAAIPLSSNTIQQETLAIKEIETSLPGEDEIINLNVHNANNKTSSKNKIRPVKLIEQLPPVIKEPITDVKAGELPSEVLPGKKEEIKEEKNNEVEEVAAGANKEKRKFRDVVKSIFGKKEEKPLQTDDEPQRTTGRQAKKREKAGFPNEVDQASLVQNIEISSHAADNWMMGIKGLKISLRNRNPFILQSAQVEVSYFDGSKKLLDKKIIVFTNVPANGKLTLPAPDHKWAEQTSTKLGNVQIREDVYVKD